MKNTVLALALAFSTAAQADWYTTPKNSYGYQGMSQNIGNQTYRYGGQGGYQGSSTHIGNQSYHYGNNGSYLGSSSRIGNSTYHYGNTGKVFGWDN